MASILWSPGLVLSKQENEEIDYSIDFSSWIDSSETIGSFTVTADVGISLGSSQKSGNVVTFRVIGGSEGSRYRILPEVTTSVSGQVFAAPFYMQVN